MMTIHQLVFELVCLENQFAQSQAWTETCMRHINMHCINISRHCSYQRCF